VLSVELGALRLKLTDSKFRPRPNDTIINWGSSMLPINVRSARVLNAPDRVAIAANKLTFFEEIRASDVPDIVPLHWLNSLDIPDEEFPIVCRTVLNGHSGAGIVIADNREELIHARLYTKYIKKDAEYRIHVAGDEVIAVQRKARRLDVPDDQVNWRIRNHENGFIFARENVTAPDRVKDIAVYAVRVLGLDFGAVDVVQGRNGQAYVLEVNSAPGLEGSTVTDYVNYFREAIR
jgi:glutathione synthase/RimK-type ligase-like ATP-grasp enzyme